MAPVQTARRWKRRAPTPDPELDSDGDGGADEDRQQLAGAVRQSTVHHANGGGAANGDDGAGDDLEQDLPPANPYTQPPPGANGGGAAADEMEEDAAAAAGAAGAAGAAAGPQTPVPFRVALTANAPATPGTPLELPAFEVPQHLRRPKIYWSAEEIQQLIRGVQKVGDRGVADKAGHRFLNRRAGRSLGVLHGCPARRRQLGQDLGRPGVRVAPDAHQRGPQGPVRRKVGRAASPLRSVR